MTGGDVVKATRQTAGSNEAWTITVEPDGDDAVTVTLPATTDCEDDGAICTGDGTMLAGPVTETVAGPGSTVQPVTATFSGLPETHDGENEFTFTLTFSEDVAGLSYATLRDSAFDVTGGNIVRAGRQTAGSNEAWTITVEPDGDDAVTVTLPETTDCSAEGAVCVDGRKLSGAVSATVPGPDSTVQPLTAWFTAVPDEHDGESAFTFRVAFSEALPAGSKAQLRRALSVTGGTKKSILRVNDRLDRWAVKVEPSGTGAVTLSLASAGACGDEAALCTEAGGQLADPVTETVPGPPGLTVADAEVNEAAEDAALAFVVRLDRAASGEVTVAYATSDGTAVAPGDYTETSGTLTFAAGVTEQTVSVPVVRDSVNEGSETMTFTLSNPTEAYLDGATATGTIKNDGPIPRAWMARFGRTVAEQVLEVVEGRMQGPRTDGGEINVAGHRVGGMAADPGTQAQRNLDDWFDEDSGSEQLPALEARILTARDLLLGSSFSLTGATERAGTYGLWGRGVVTRFDGREGDLSLDGEVTSGMLGADWSRDALMAGLVISHSVGEGGYRGETGGGSVRSSLTGIYPWGRYTLSERLSVWGVVGYGQGELTVTPEGYEPMETDLDLTMAAAGLRHVLVQASAGGFELAVKSDVLGVQTNTSAVPGLDAECADVTRLRLGLEGSRSFRFSDWGSLTPSIEIGLRRDGGDAETGFGVEIGAGLAWSNVRHGLSAEFRGRGLLSHEADEFRESGFSGSLSWDPTPDTALGPSASVTQAVGGQSTGGVDALFSPQIATVPQAGNNGGLGHKQRTLEARFGYGLALFDGGYTGTPQLGMGITPTGRELVLGWQLAEEKTRGLAFRLGVEGAQQESVVGEAGHRYSLGFGWRLNGAHQQGFEVRFEGSRLGPANYAAEDRVGIILAGSW